MRNRMKTFPVLQVLMIKHGITIGDLARITGRSYPTIFERIHMKKDFSFTDMLKIKQFFVNKGEDLTIDEIFYEWLEADESGNGKVIPIIRKCYSRKNKN